MIDWFKRQTLDRWTRAARDRAMILSFLAEIRQQGIRMVDKIDEVGAAVGRLKTAVDSEVADLKELRNEATTSGALNPDQTQRLDAIIGNLNDATAELTADDAPATAGTTGSSTPATGGTTAPVVAGNDGDGPTGAPSDPALAPGGVQTSSPAPSNPATDVPAGSSEQ